MTIRSNVKYIIIILFAICCISVSAGERLRDVRGCSTNYGCNTNGYCWSECSALFYTGWCYSTKSYSQSYKYIPCEKASQCDPCDSCADPCSPSPKPRP